MSRLTGKEVYSLMEAYQAVYAPQELTEEQVWEGVENWVHSLLEEGYDLSDYTWEEMYENYITENPNMLSTALGAADKFANNTIGNISADVARKKTGNIPVVSDIAAEVGRSAGQGAYKDVKTNLGAGNISGALKTASSALTMLKQNYEPDAFDYILEHLVGNGYADSNDSAIVIMANMSEDWKYSILEDVRGGPSFSSNPIIDAGKKIVGGILDRYRGRSLQVPNIPQKPVPNSGPVLRDDPLWDGPSVHHPELDGLPTKPQPKPKPKPGPVLRDEPLF